MSFEGRIPNLETFEAEPGFHWTGHGYALSSGCTWCGGPTPCECDHLPAFDPDIFYHGEQHGNRR